MSDDLQTIETRSVGARLALAALVVVVLVFVWFSVRWQIGSMFATYTSATDPNAREVAEMARSLSPSDPATNWLLASTRRETFRPAEVEAAVGDLENAVRAAPYDYRYWTELGRAYEQTDRFDAAEKAFARAAELAPNYSNAQWHLGNFYLRRGDEAKAFAALRKSAEMSAVYSEQVYSVLWDFYEKDKSKLEQLAGDRAELRAGLAKFYAGKELAPDSLRVWNSVPDADKTRYADIARLIGQALYDKRYYRSSIEFVRQLGIEPDARSESFLNGGFEQPIAADPRDTYFGWQVIKKEKMDAGPDSMKKKEGNRSLRITFNGFAGVELKNILEIVAVEPSRKYRVSFWLKTENLKSAGTPTLEVLNASDQKILATTPAFPTGTQDWTQIALDFATPEAAEAVVVRFDRAYCGDNCPIVGTVWVDDFRLEKN